MKTIHNPRCLAASLPTFHNHPSPFLGEWILFSLSPMDFDWDKFPTVDSLWEPEYPGQRADSWTALHLGAFLQVVMNAGYSIANDHREDVRLIYLPSDCNAELHGFVWKNDNNGATYVLLKQQSAQHLAPLMGLGKFNEPTLITLS